MFCNVSDTYNEINYSTILCKVSDSYNDFYITITILRNISDTQQFRKKNLCNVSNAYN